MAKFHGVQIFEILDNGNLLSGVYTNSGAIVGAAFTFGNEIMRKAKRDDKGPEGSYEGRYLETDEKNLTAVPCTLEIIRRGSAYKLIWRSENKIIFNGIGLLVGDQHLAISYTK